MHLIPVSRRCEGGPANPAVTKNLPPTAGLTTDDFALVTSNASSDILRMANLARWNALRDYLVSTTVINYVRLPKLDYFSQIDKID